MTEGICLLVCCADVTAYKSFGAALKQCYQNSNASAKEVRDQRGMVTVLPPASVAVDRVLVEEDVARCGQAVTNYTLSSIGADGATVGIIQSTVPSHFSFCCLCQETPDLTPTNALLLSVCHCCCYLVCMYVIYPDSVSSAPSVLSTVLSPSVLSRRPLHFRA